MKRLLVVLVFTLVASATMAQTKDEDNWLSPQAALLSRSEGTAVYHEPLAASMNRPKKPLGLGEENFFTTEDRLVLEGLPEGFRWIFIKKGTPGVRDKESGAMIRDGRCDNPIGAEWPMTPSAPEKVAPPAEPKPEVKPVPTQDPQLAELQKQVAELKAQLAKQTTTPPSAPAPPQVIVVDAGSGCQQCGSSIPLFSFGVGVGGGWVTPYGGYGGYSQPPIYNYYNNYYRGGGYHGGGHVHAYPAPRPAPRGRGPGGGTGPAH